ncbi:MAG: PQQ-binding-like beta-propeller repeat protein [Chloroflexia bacterium]|nr:PQQ-binding-like beta-propeller repeat protein [Chloroflexia bacterium]
MFRRILHTSLALSILCILLVGLGPAQAQGGADYYPPHILDRPLGIEPLPNGNVLITDAGGAFYTLTDDALLEVNREGEIIWQYVGDMRFPHSAERLDDGSTLVSDTANNRIFQLDAGGQILWSSDDWGDGSGTLNDGSHLHYPNDVELLEPGVLLVTDRNNDRVIEVTTGGVILWQYGVLDRPHNADRLANGNTIICNSEADLVIEVNRAGKVVWSFGETTALNWPRDADRLPDGHTLVTDTRNGRVLEVTPEGQVVWSFGGLGLPYEADRLANGNTLIADNNHKRVIEVNPAGEIVWSFHNFDESYPDELQNGDFEQDTDGDGLPDGWYPADMNAEGPATFLWDAGMVQHGQYSAGLAYEGEGRASWVQVVAVEPEQIYRFSGYLRSNLLQGVGVYQLWFLDEMGGPIGDPITVEPILQGTTEWQQAKTKAVAPAEARAVQIWCHITLDPAGQVWFDQVRWQTGAGVSLFMAGGLVLGVLLLGGLLFWLARRSK